MNPPQSNPILPPEPMGPGELDALTPEQVGRLEVFLNTQPSAAARFGAVKPARDPVLDAALAVLDARQPAPPAREWGAMWARIEAAQTAGARVLTPKAGRPHILRVWQPLAALAACLLLALFWSVGGTAIRAAPDWPMQLAADVEINSLAVGDGVSSLVLETGEDQNVTVIWVLADRG